MSDETPNETQWLREALQNREKEFERIFMEMRNEIHQLTREKEQYRTLNQSLRRRLEEYEIPDSVTSGHV